MNKQELIKIYEDTNCTLISIDGVLEDLRQLDEPQKTVVPQFVADWIETCKENNIISLSGAFEYAKEEVDTWLSDWKNQEIFASAWIFGYEVEKKKRYLVKMEGVTDQTRTLKRNIDIETWYFGNPTNYEDVNAHHTRKELEEAGFGWVFDCEGIEIEEVEDDSKI